MQLVIVSGLSGAGKTVALKQLEDRGWYCVDNLPLALVQPLIVHAVDNPHPRYERVAISVDARAQPQEIRDFPDILDSLRSQGVQVRVLFLTSDEPAILRRYAETRRKHPLTSAEVSLADAIRLERVLLGPVADLADVTVDTSTMKIDELRGALLTTLPGQDGTPLTLTFLSFGYKNGVPEAVDFIFDARCLPNPHWEPALRALSGSDPAVIEYFESRPEVSEYRVGVQAFLTRWLPLFGAQGRPYVTVAIGCTGGHHRSVYLAEQLAAAFQDTAVQVVVRHRDRR